MRCKQELSDVTCALEVAIVRSDDPYFTPPHPPHGGALGAHQKLSQYVK